eukprot:3004931-Rhodomonas_salina.1
MFYRLNKSRNAAHFVPEDAKGSGSVFSLTSGEEGKQVQEWVVISIEIASGFDGVIDPGVRELGIRVMGWVNPVNGSTAEFTEWDLFRAVTEEIETLEELTCGIESEVLVPVVMDSYSGVVDRFTLEECFDQEVFEVDHGGSAVEVQRHQLIPCKTPLLTSADHSLHTSQRPRVL